MIDSRYARRTSAVCGIPHFANRLLQMGLLSSMAGKPLSLATNARGEIHASYWSKR